MVKTALGNGRHGIAGWHKLQISCVLFSDKRRQLTRGGGSKGNSILGGQSGSVSTELGGRSEMGVGGVESMGHSTGGSVVRGAFREYGKQSRDERWGTTAQGWASPGTELIGL